MKTALFIFLFPLLLSAQNGINKELFTQGEKLYTQTCISCHGINGETNPQMKLIVKPRKLVLTILSQEQIYKVIKEGANYWGAHSDIMPAFKHVFDEQELRAVAYYTSQNFNPQRDSKIKQLLKESKKLTYSKEKTYATGQKIFKRNCSLCHGVMGNGESLYVEESKIDNQFIYPYDLRKTILTENQIFLFAKFGGHFWGADKKDMPSWKEKYNDEQLKSVAKYINQKIKVPHSSTH